MRKATLWQNKAGWKLELTANDEIVAVSPEGLVIHFYREDNGQISYNRDDIIPPKEVKMEIELWAGRKRIYRVTTPYGGVYDFDRRSHGVIRRENCSFGLPHDSWRIVGVWWYTGGGHTQSMQLYKFIPKLEAGEIKLELGNGKPRYGLVDIDHGTTRQHGNKDVHGIKDFYNIA